MYPDWALLNDDDYKSGTANQAGGLNEVDYFRCNDEEAETPQLGSAPEYMYLPRLNSLLKTKTSHITEKALSQLTFPTIYLGNLNASKDSCVNSRFFSQDIGCFNHLQPEPF